MTSTEASKIDLAVLDLLLSQPPAPPKYCDRCYHPAVRDEGCRYCERYGRACGRHDRDHTCGVRS